MHGPIAIGALLNLIRGRRLPESIPVWSQGMPGFVPAHTVPAVASIRDELAPHIEHTST